MTRSFRKAGAAALSCVLSAMLLADATWSEAAAITLHEAEQATVLSGALRSDHTGFTGTGYVDSANVLGAAIEFTVTTAVVQTLTFRYANGTTTSRPATLTLNGASAATLSFPSTGAWTSWQGQTAAVTLTAGTTAVRITATTAAGLANIDSLTVSDGQVGGGPISDPIPQHPIASGLGLILAEYAQFPKSEPVPTPTDSRLIRHARINHLGEVPGDSGRRYVPDLNGKLYFLPAAGGAPSIYLDVRARYTNFYSGRGLGSGFAFVAFHPQFASNGRFYTVHSEAFNALSSQTPDWTQSGAVIHSVLTEWTATNPAASVFSGTSRQLMRIGFGAYIHGIQQVEFNPNATPGSSDHGLLYVAVGDGGRGNSTTQPQTLSVPFGKLLRIDPRGNNSANRRYGIPAGNPFVGQAGALGEIYALGMRDPHRLSWDRGGTGRMFLGHIGEHDIEGVYDVRAGDNFGWSEREGPYVFNRAEPCNLYPLPADDRVYGYDYPVAAYDHNPPPGTSCTADVGRAIAGGFVYRGTALPMLTGRYIFGDLVQGWVFYTNENQMVRGGTTAAQLAPLYELSIYTPTGSLVTMKTLAGGDRVDLRFGLDRAGDLYLLSKANGKIWKVTGVRGTTP